MGTDDREHLAAVAERAARAGGAVVRAGFRRARSVEAKAPGDWVSEVDRASEAAIKELLAREAPGLAFLGEESGGRRAEVGWIVDPLDGTANFLHEFPVVGVSVALVEDGLPTVGVVHAPLLGETYRAVAGRGAWHDARRLSVGTGPVAEAICATGFPFRAKDRLDAYLPVFERALRTFEDLRRAGAATLDLAWVAAGAFDGFFELGLGAWDVAAGALLVREAGGVVTDWSGDEEAWLETGDILAGTPAVHEALLRLVGQVL